MVSLKDQFGAAQAAVQGLATNLKASPRGLLGPCGPSALAGSGSSRTGVRDALRER
jgi:hypothetical protein